MAKKFFILDIILNGEEELHSLRDDSAQYKKVVETNAATLHNVMSGHGIYVGAVSAGVKGFRYQFCSLSDRNAACHALDPITNIVFSSTLWQSGESLVFVNRAKIDNAIRDYVLRHGMPLENVKSVILPDDDEEYLLRFKSRAEVLTAGNVKLIAYDDKPKSISSAPIGHYCFVQHSHTDKRSSDDIGAWGVHFSFDVEEQIVNFFLSADEATKMRNGINDCLKSLSGGNAAVPKVVKEIIDNIKDRLI